MIDRKTALQLAQQWFDSSAKTTVDMAFAAVDEKEIIEASIAWILPWNDRRYFEGNSRYGIDGNNPLVVLKSDGTVMELPKLTASECEKWKTTKRNGTMEHRLANLAEKLGVKNE